MNYLNTLHNLHIQYGKHEDDTENYLQTTSIVYHWLCFRYNIAFLEKHLHVATTRHCSFGNSLGPVV